MLTDLPSSIQLEILKIVNDHSATSRVCKSLKPLADEAQSILRKELFEEEIEDWKKSWDSFSYITKKEWGIDDLPKECDCVKPDECEECKWDEVKNDWEMDTRHFVGASMCDIEKMVTRVFEDRFLVSDNYQEMPPPFQSTKRTLIFVFRNRVVMITEPSSGGVDIKLRDHRSDGIQPILINSRWHDKMNEIENDEEMEMVPFGSIGMIKKSFFLQASCDIFFRNAGEMACLILSVIDRNEFAIKICNVHMLRSGRFFHLKNFHGYNRATLMEEMKFACNKYKVDIIPDEDDFGEPTVMLAWENGPIAFSANRVLFTSKNLEKIVPKHILKLL